MTDRIKWLYLLVGLLAGAGAVFVADRFPGGRGEGGRLAFCYEEGRTYRIQEVFDGDTVVIEPGIRLRYAGVDAPETGRFIKDVKPFGAEATEANKRLVAGRQVRLTLAPARFDHWGRMLAGLEVQDPETGKWLDVEEELVRAGLAWRMPGAGPVRNEVRLKRAEEAAKAAGLGVHSRSAEKPGPGGN